MTGAESVEAASAFQHHFPPNPVKHGRYLGIDPETGKKRVETRDGQPVTADMVARHLGMPGKLNAWGLGYLPGFQDGTPCGLIDLDEKELSSGQFGVG